MTATKKLERIQKRALRFVLEDFTSDYDTLLTKAKYRYNFNFSFEIGGYGSV